MHALTPWANRLVGAHLPSRHQPVCSLSSPSQPINRSSNDLSHDCSRLTQLGCHSPSSAIARCVVDLNFAHTERTEWRWRSHRQSHTIMTAKFIQAAVVSSHQALLLASADHCNSPSWNQTRLQTSRMLRITNVIVVMKSKIIEMLDVVPPTPPPLFKNCVNLKIVNLHRSVPAKFAL